jgi:hypothetical protein
MKYMLEKKSDYPPKLIVLNESISLAEIIHESTVKITL